MNGFSRPEQLWSYLNCFVISWALTSTQTIHCAVCTGMHLLCNILFPLYNEGQKILELMSVISPLWVLLCNHWFETFVLFCLHKYGIHEWTDCHHCIRLNERLVQAFWDTSIPWHTHIFSHKNNKFLCLLWEPLSFLCQVRVLLWQRYFQRKTITLDAPKKFWKIVLHRGTESCSEYLPKVFRHCKVLTCSWCSTFLVTFLSCHLRKL